MVSIEEIPIDVSEEAQPESEEAQVEELLQTIEEEAPAPKRRGRPPGAKNRAKPKVVAKRKPRAPPPPPSEYEEESEEEEEPPPPPIRRARSRAAPTEYEEEEVFDARTVAAEMLQMLSRRNADKHHAKRAKYASWFPTNRAVY